MTDDLITVPQVFKFLGIQPTNSVSWSVGSRIATMYADKHGAQPPKDNRPKTNGQGSHCFALYPRSWQQTIIEVIKEEVAIENSQRDLWGDEQT